VTPQRLGARRKPLSAGRRATAMDMEARSIFSTAFPKSTCSRTLIFAHP
jgi:hypothetical protein